MLLQLSIAAAVAAGGDLQAGGVADEALPAPSSLTVHASLPRSEADAAVLAARRFYARTVLKGGIGTFVGTVPLSVPAFAEFPVRFDQGSLRPRVSGLARPRALVLNARLEQRVAPGWDAVVGVVSRRASHLATLDVRREEGSLLVTSTGRSTYREAEAAIRHTWGRASQLFLSYTRSSAHGELNDFATLFAAGDVEILQRGARARLAADAPNRVLAWGAFDLPAEFGLSPAAEWHSGFPYAVIDVSRGYVGPPNGASFPAFFSFDLLVNKALTIMRKRVKLNVQLFNVTNHSNPATCTRWRGARGSDALRTASARPCAATSRSTGRDV